MSAYAFLMVVDAARPSHADKSPRFRALEADEDHLGVVDLAAWRYRSALVADGLTRDGQHTRALALANELLEDPPGTHEYKVIGRLARTALHGHDDGPARLAAIATAALARLP